jgi:hypothetical protein
LSLWQISYTEASEIPLTDIPYQAMCFGASKRIRLRHLSLLANFIFQAIVSLRPEDTSETLERIDSLTGPNGSIGDASIDDSTSSAVSSSFQGSETKSVQDELTPETSAENSLPEKRLPGIERDRSSFQIFSVDTPAFEIISKRES